MNKQTKKKKKKKKKRKKKKKLKEKVRTEKSSLFGTVNIQHQINLVRHNN